VVKPAAQREAVRSIVELHSFSERRACGLIRIGRSTWSYRSRRPPDEDVRSALRELAAKRPRFGYRRLHVLIGREGHRMNHKRLYRLYRSEGLAVRRKKRKRLTRERRPMPPPERLNARWSMDFMQDRFGLGRKFRTFNLVDEFSRECPAIEVDTSIRAARVIRVLDRVADERGLPGEILVDNGTEFTSRALDTWAHERGVKLHFIRPGKPNDNPYIESFNGKFRDECLNENWFTTLRDARFTIETWRRDYNQVRPHSSLDNMTPEEFATAAANRRSATPTSDPQPHGVTGDGLSLSLAQ
jgi:putative transposase